MAEMSEGAREKIREAVLTRCGGCGAQFALLQQEIVYMFFYLLLAWLRK